MKQRIWFGANRSVPARLEWGEVRLYALFEHRGASDTACGGCKRAVNLFAAPRSVLRAATCSRSSRSHSLTCYLQRLVCLFAAMF